MIEAAKYYNSLLLLTQLSSFLLPWVNLSYQNPSIRLQTKAVPLSIKIGDTDSACNTVKEAIETLPSQPITNIVANYSSELNEISDEELTLAENCENDEEQTENNCELLVGFLKKMG